MDTQTGRPRRPADRRDPVQQPVCLAAAHRHLRGIEVLDYTRAVILDDDGTRYTVDGRRLPPVALTEVSIFTGPH
jgi:hypothetical protein